MGLTLAGCASLRELPPPDAAVLVSLAQSGRLAVRVEGSSERSFSASFDLQGTARAGRMSLSTPLGTQLAIAQWQPGRAWLRSDSEVREFANLDELAEGALGEPIPLAALFDWLAGRPWPEADSQALPASAQGFMQQGWEVRLEQRPAGIITATRQATPRVTLRVKLDAP